jgi:hypothetical protein
MKYDYKDLKRAKTMLSHSKKIGHRLMIIAWDVEVKRITDYLKNKKGEAK